MSLTGMSGNGKIRLFNDFLGPEIPIGNAVAYGSTAGGCHSFIGDFKLTGSIHDTDSGIVSVGKASGYARLLSSASANGDGLALGTEVSLSPALNGALVLEARVEMAALTARNVFIGFSSANADEAKEPATATTTTITKVVPCVGFLFDSQLTASTGWHMPYILASDTTQTSTNVVSSQTAVAAESDVLRIQVNPDGSAEWWINGKLEQTVGAGLAATPATLMAALVGVWSTTTTVGSLDVDFIEVTANRDWTR